MSSFTPPFAEYENSTSFFGDETPLPEGVGWAVVVGFGAVFSVITTILVFLNRYFAGEAASETSEHFK